MYEYVTLEISMIQSDELHHFSEGLWHHQPDKEGGPTEEPRVRASAGSPTLCHPLSTGLAEYFRREVLVFLPHKILGYH